MTSRIQSCPHLKPLWKHNYVPFADFVRVRRSRLSHAQKKSRSQVDMAYDILKRARTPLHVSEMIDRIQTQFGVAVDRESLVSSLSKKVARQDRFLRPEKNTFSLRPEVR
jgi:DNA-directed RNA polymerase delta subunit